MAQVVITVGKYWSFVPCVDYPAPPTYLVWELREIDASPPQGKYVEWWSTCRVLMPGSHIT